MTQAGDREGLARLHDVPLDVSARLGSRSMTIGELLALREGAVVELDGLASSPIDVLAGGTPIARGEIVAVEDRFGVRITELISRP